MADKFAGYMPGLTSPIIGGFAITPNDSTDLPYVTRQIRVTGNAGNIVVVWSSGETTTEPVQTGDILDWRIVRVLATGTAATGLRGYY